VSAGLLLLLLLAPSAHADQPPVAPPPAAVEPPPWADAREATVGAARGGLDVCESLTFPLQLIPTVGTLVAMVVEWSCVPPTVFTVEHLQRFHGTLDGKVWKSLVALTLSKLWRDLWRIAGVVTLLTAVGGVGLGALVAAVATVVSVPGLAFYAPVAVGGLVTVGGLVLMVLRATRKAGADLIFEWTFNTLAGEFSSDAARVEARGTSPLAPPYNLAERTWLLATTAAGSEPPFRWVHLVPFAGPLVRGREKVATLRTSMRRLSSETLQEKDRTLLPMDVAIVGLCAAEAAMDVLAQAALTMGAAVFVLGTLSTLAWLQDPRQHRVAGAITAVTGLLSSSAAGLGIILLIGRELPVLLEPVVIPLTYGLFPPRGLSGAE